MRFNLKTIFKKSLVTENLCYIEYLPNSYNHNETFIYISKQSVFLLYNL